MLKFGDWVNRKRHNRGFGIQSPSTFFFITEVLRERLPYYFYPQLDTIADEGNSISRKRAKELFRITNHHNPRNCIATGSSVAACAMAAAKPTAQKRCIDETPPGDMASRMLETLNCPTMTGNMPTLLKMAIEELQGVDMLYIGNVTEYAELWNIAVKHVNEDSIIVVEGIHGNKAIESWWQEVVESPATVITYDLYSCGIALFNKERYKQNYKLKR